MAVGNQVMTTQSTNPKRWRPRLSFRTLVILITLVCCYFGLWEATKRQGVADVARLADTNNDEDTDLGMGICVG